MQSHFNAVLLAFLMEVLTAFMMEILIAFPIQMSCITKDNLQIWDQGCAHFIWVDLQISKFCRIFNNIALRKIVILSMCLAGCCREHTHREGS